MHQIINYPCCCILHQLKFPNVLGKFHVECISGVQMRVQKGMSDCEQCPPPPGSIRSDGQSYKFNKSMNKQMDLVIQKNAKALWTMVALQAGFTNPGALDWVLGLFWNSTTPSRTKDGRSQASACSDIQSYSVLLELSWSLLDPIQAYTTSRHWDRMSKTSLR